MPLTTLIGLEEERLAESSGLEGGWRPLGGGEHIENLLVTVLLQSAGLQLPDALVALWRPSWLQCCCSLLAFSCLTRWSHCGDPLGYSAAAVCWPSAAWRAGRTVETLLVTVLLQSAGLQLPDALVALWRPSWLQCCCSLLAFSCLTRWSHCGDPLGYSTAAVCWPSAAWRAGRTVETLLVTVLLQSAGLQLPDALVTLWRPFWLQSAAVCWPSAAWRAGHTVETLLVTVLQSAGLQLPDALVALWRPSWLQYCCSLLAFSCLTRWSHCGDPLGYSLLQSAGFQLPDVLVTLWRPSWLQCCSLLAFSCLTRWSHCGDPLGYSAAAVCWPSAAWRAGRTVETFLVTVLLQSAGLQLPDALVALWRPLLWLLHTAHITPLLIDSLISAIDEGNSLRNRLLAGWAATIVTAICDASQYEYVHYLCIFYFLPSFFFQYYLYFCFHLSLLSVHNYFTCAISFSF